MRYEEIYIGKIITHLYQLDTVTKRDIKKAFKVTPYIVDVEESIREQIQEYLNANNIDCEIDDEVLKLMIEQSCLTQSNIKRELYNATHKTLYKVLNLRLEIDEEEIQPKYQDLYIMVLKEISQEVRNIMDNLKNIVACNL